jgi:hypothetical protein
MRVNKSRGMRATGHVARNRDMKNAYIILVCKPEGKRPLQRQKCSSEDNIKMNLNGTCCEVMDWINLVQDRFQ